MKAQNSSPFGASAASPSAFGAPAGGGSPFGQQQHAQPSQGLYGAGTGGASPFGGGGGGIRPQGSMFGGGGGIGAGGGQARACSPLPFCDACQNTNIRSTPLPCLLSRGLMKLRLKKDRGMSYRLRARAKLVLDIRQLPHPLSEYFPIVYPPTCSRAH